MSETAVHLAQFAEELEATANVHREQMSAASDPVEAAEHRGISRGLLFVATKIRTALLAHE